MGLMDVIRNDIAKFTSNKKDFGVDISFIAPDNTTVIVAGTAKKHHLSIDSMGNAVNSKTASCSVAESLLTALSYPVRNASGDVSLKNHIVKWTDSTGTLQSYKIREWFPDETVGLIVCILSDFNNG